MTEREIELLELLKENPMASQEELAKKMIISRSTVSVYITSLMKKGYIEGRKYVLSEDYIVCIGSVIVDITGYASEILTRRDKNPKALVKTSPGGVVRNIGENLGRMGVNVKVLSSLGDDYYSKIILDSCHEAGIDTREIRVVKDGSTALYISINQPNGELELGLTDMSITEYIDENYLKSKKQILERARAIVLSPDIPDKSMDYLHKNFYDVPKFIDVTSVDYAQKVATYSSMFHTIKANELEMEALTGIKLRDKSDLKKSAEAMLKKGVQHVYISLGNKGAFYMNKSGQMIFDKANPPENIVSATGAGDAFMAGIVYSYLNHFDSEKSIQFAGAASGLALASRFANNPEISASKVLDHMRRRGGI